MPIKRYKAEQIVTMLRQIEVSIANGKTTPQACKEAEITMQTFYRGRSRTSSHSPAHGFNTGRRLAHHRRSMSVIAILRQPSGQICTGC
jgi:hypothetical protein